MVVQARLLKVDAPIPSRVEARLRVMSLLLVLVLVRLGLRHDGVVVRAAADRLVARVVVAQPGRRGRLAPPRASRQHEAAGHAPAAAPGAQLVLGEVLGDLGAEAQAGHQEGEEVADRGEARAEDGAVDFDHGPGGRVGPVP